jgi:hypothetical protein
VDFDRRGGIGLTVGDGRILLPHGPSSDLLNAVQAVRQHLAADKREYDELDARFGGWIVVRRRGV